jgi:hypothetical protein
MAVKETLSSTDPTRLLSDLARETYNVERNDSATNPGPQNSGLVKLNPNSDVPPPTDHGVVEPFSLPGLPIRSRRSARTGVSFCWCLIKATFPKRAPFSCRIG